MQKWMIRFLTLATMILCLSGTSLAETLSLLPSVPSSTLPENNVTKTQPTTLKGAVHTLAGKYLLSPGDTINISVYDAPEFSQQGLVVRPDGFVTVNPFGEMKVAGKDIDEATQFISDKLKIYLRQPQVALTVSKFHPAIVYVLGAVQKPGSYEIHGDTTQPDSPNALLIRGRLTVSNLIANAGGVTQRANLENVEVRNNVAGTERTANLLSLLKQGDTSQDLVVRSGDTVYVPTIANHQDMDDETFKLVTKSALAPGGFAVRVLGNVATPGVYTLSAQSPGINSAIASAHGYTVNANTHIVKVMREEANGKLTEIKVDPNQSDFMLRDNDVVFVDERGIPIAGRGLDYAQRFFLPFFTVGSFANAILDIFDPGRRYPAYLFRPR